MPTKQTEKRQRREERLARERERAEAQARRRFLGLVVAGGMAAAALVAVAVVIATGGGDGGGGGTQAAANEPIVDVHGIGVNPADGAVYLATHTGLFRAAAGERRFRRVDGPSQDLMGFSVAGPDRFVASGHPGPGQDLPNPIGLIDSGDRGKTWKSLSRLGESDFHVLEASGRYVYGFDGELRTSADGGRTWDEREAPGEIVDLAADPKEPRRVLAATGDGFQLSSDAGKAWTAVARQAPALLAWARDGSIYAVDGDGRVFASRDARRWRQTGAVQGPPGAFAVDDGGKLYVAHPDGAIVSSDDGGATWAARVDT